MKTSPGPASARVSWWLETSSIYTSFPGRVSIPSAFVSLFIFYILSYLPLKTMGCFSGHLMSAASDQKLFCELCSAFNCSFWWICRREIGLPVLFLCHLGSSPSFILHSKSFNPHKCEIRGMWIAQSLKARSGRIEIQAVWLESGIRELLCELFSQRQHSSVTNIPHAVAQSFAELFHFTSFSSVQFSSVQLLCCV